MSKTAKKIIAMITTFSIAFGMFTFKPAKAVDMNLVDAWMDSALTCETFYHYNMAYNTVLQIEDENIRNPYLWKLAEVAPKVWNSELANLIDRLNTIPQTKNAKSYDEIHKAITDCKLNETDKNYLLNELCSWGKKMVYTEDYTKALDALIKAWDTKSQEDINKAKELIENVKHKDNKAYLNDELNKVIASNAVYIVDGQVDLKDAKTRDILIFDKNGNKLENNKDYGVTTSNEKFNLMIFNKDIEEIKTVVYGENFEVTENTMKLEKGSNKMEVKAVEGGQAQVKINLKDKRGNALIKSGVTVKITDKYGVDFGTSDKDGVIEDGLFTSSKTLSKGEYTVSIEKEGRYNKVNEVIKIDKENMTKELTKTIEKKSSSGGGGGTVKPEIPETPETPQDLVIDGSEIKEDTITLEKDHYKDVKIDSNGKKVDLKGKTIDGTLTINGAKDIDLVNNKMSKVVIEDKEYTVMDKVNRLMARSSISNLMAIATGGENKEEENNDENKQVYFANNEIDTMEINSKDILNILVEGSKNKIKDIELKSPVVFENAGNSDAIDNININLKDEVKESKVEMLGNFGASKLLINSGKNINIDGVINQVVVDAETNINFENGSKIENIEINNSNVALSCDENKDINVIAEVINNAKVKDGIDNGTLKDIENKVNDPEFKKEKENKEKEFLEKFNKIKDENDDYNIEKQKEKELMELIFGSEYKYVKFNRRVRNYTEEEKHEYARRYMLRTTENQFNSIDEINQYSYEVYSKCEVQFQGEKVKCNDIVISDEEQDITDKLFTIESSFSSKANMNILGIYIDNKGADAFEIRKDDKNRQRVFYVPDKDKNFKGGSVQITCDIQYLDSATMVNRWSEITISKDKDELELINKFNSLKTQTDENIKTIKEILFDSGKFDFSYVRDFEKDEFSKTFIEAIGERYNNFTKIVNIEQYGETIVSMMDLRSLVTSDSVNLDDIKPEFDQDVTDFFIKQDPKKPKRDGMEIRIDSIIYDTVDFSDEVVEGFRVDDNGKLHYMKIDESIKNKPIRVVVNSKFGEHGSWNMGYGSIKLTINKDKGEKTIVDKINEITEDTPENIEKMKKLLFGEENKFNFSEEMVTMDERDSFAREYIQKSFRQGFANKEDVKKYAPIATVSVQFDKLNFNKNVTITDEDNGKDVTDKIITNLPNVDINDENIDLDGNHPREIFEYKIGVFNYNQDCNNYDNNKLVDGFCVKDGRIIYNGSKEDIIDKEVQVSIIGKFKGQVCEYIKYLNITVNVEKPESNTTNSDTTSNSK